jgi:hypothetical protein
MQTDSIFVRHTLCSFHNPGQRFFVTNSRVQRAVKFMEIHSFNELFFPSTSKDSLHVQDGEGVFHNFFLHLPSICPFTEPSTMMKANTNSDRKRKIDGYHSEKGITLHTQTSSLRAFAVVTRELCVLKKTFGNLIMARNLKFLL